jgi:hypothetical protein
MDPEERGKRFAWPEGVSGFHAGMSVAEFDALCAGSKLTVDDHDGSHVCLKLPGPAKDAMLVSGRFCGASTACEVGVSDGRTDETDAEWLAAFEARRREYVEKYGPPTVEESTAPGCEGERLVTCTGDGRAMRRYTWVFFGMKSGKAQALFVTLGLQPITITTAFRNQVWLKQQHDADGG